MITFLIIVFLLLSALFSGAEIAFISADKLKVELRKKKGARRGAILAHFYENPADFLGTMLVGNNIVLVVFTSLMTIPLNQLFREKLLIQSEGLLLFINTFIITIFLLIFGEFLPKTLFRYYADEVLYFLAYPLRVVKWLLTAPAWLMTKTAGLLLRLAFKTPLERSESAFTRLDLENFVNKSRSHEAEEIDKELFGNVLNLRDVRLRECMVPRPEIEHIDASASVADLDRLFRETKLSRILVTHDEIDNVLGYVHHQQLLKMPEDIRSLIMDISFVPEVMRATDLLNRFIKDRTNIACVVDEFGGLAGVITLEDILEEIFGEIEDEYDDTEEHLEMQISDNEFVFAGRLEIDYLNEKYPHLELPVGDYHTLSGYLVMTSGQIPEQGAIVERDGFQFVLELVSNTKIETVRVIKLPAED